MKIITIITIITICANIVNAQWLKTNGPNGGHIECFAISGTTIFAGTSDGVFMSVNNGGNWTEANNGLTVKSIRTLAISGTTIFAGTFYQGVFMSIDSGKSWTAMNNGLPSTQGNGLPLIYISSFAVNGTDVFVGIPQSTSDPEYNDGIYRFDNDRKTWTMVKTGISVEALTISGKTLFAGTSDGNIYKSIIGRDSVSDWVEITTDLPKKTISIKSFAINGTTIFIGTMGGGIFMSSDNGASWTTANTGLVRTHVNLRNGVVVHEPVKNISSLIVSGTTIFSGTQDGFFISTNNGASWAPANNGLTDNVVRALAVNGTTIFAGTLYGGTFKSVNNGAEWKAINTGLTDMFISSLFIRDTTIFASAGERIFMSNNNGLSWENLRDSTLRVFNSDFRFPLLAINSKNIFVSTENGVFMSEDSGANWIPINLGIAGQGTRKLQALAFMGTSIFALAYSYGYPKEAVLKSIDKGVNWTKCSNITEDFLDFGYQYQSLAINEATILVGTKTKGIFMSANNGDSWMAVNSGLAISGLENTVDSIHKYPSVFKFAISGKTIFAGTSEGVFISSDNGKSWKHSMPDVSGKMDCFSMAICGRTILVGTCRKVFMSTDNGANWKTIAPGLTGLIRTIAISDKIIFIGTDNGVWKASLSDFEIK